MAEVTQGITFGVEIVEEGASHTKDKHLAELANDNSDKVFTVPANASWEVLYLRYELTATATVGTRTPTIQFRDDGDDILYDIAGPTVTASGSSTQECNSSDTALDLYLPPMILHAGYDVRVADTAAIDAAADGLAIHLLVRERADLGL